VTYVLVHVSDTFVLSKSTELQAYTPDLDTIHQDIRNSTMESY